MDHVSLATQAWLWLTYLRVEIYTEQIRPSPISTFELAFGAAKYASHCAGNQDDRLRVVIETDH